LRAEDKARCLGFRVKGTDWHGVWGSGFRAWVVLCAEDKARWEQEVAAFESANPGYRGWLKSQLAKKERVKAAAAKKKAAKAAAKAAQVCAASASLLCLPQAVDQTLCPLSGGTRKPPRSLTPSWAAMCCGGRGSRRRRRQTMRMPRRTGRTTRARRRQTTRLGPKKVRMQWVSEPWAPARARAASHPAPASERQADKGRPPAACAPQRKGALLVPGCAPRPPSLPVRQIAGAFRAVFTPALRITCVSNSVRTAPIPLPTPGALAGNPHAASPPTGLELLGADAPGDGEVLLGAKVVKCFYADDTNEKEEFTGYVEDYDARSKL
jgi:hypothetical protein